MVGFLDTCNLLKLNQHDTNNINRSIMSSEIEALLVL